MVHGIYWVQYMYTGYGWDMAKQLWADKVELGMVHRNIDVYILSGKYTKGCDIWIVDILR